MSAVEPPPRSRPRGRPLLAPGPGRARRQGDSFVLLRARRQRRNRDWVPAPGEHPDRPHSPIAFAELAGGAEILEAEGLRLCVASARYLIRTTEATGRAKDAAGADALRRLREATADG